MGTRGKTFKKKVSAILAISMLFALLFANTVFAEETAETPDTSIVESVVVNTTVTTAGQYPETMEVTVTEAAALEGLTAEDFTLAGQATGWMTPLHDFTATISEVAVSENVLTLTITDFADKFFYVDNFTVTCEKNDKLTFTDEKVTEVITPVADEYEQIRTADGANLDYNLYTPEDTTKAQPLVITFHGFLDDDNLLQNRLAIAWAYEENQAERPCYVMAPLMGGYSYYQGAARDAMYVKVYEEIQKMIDEGKVDPKQIYVVGKSFGGRAVYEFLAKYPELPAGAIAMCGAMETYFSDPVAFENIVDIPLWIAHATTDPTVKVDDSRKVYNTLVDLGSTVVHFTEYSDEEMAAAGVTTAMGNHSMEAVVLEDPSYMEWLFRQDKTMIADVVVNTTVTIAGQYPETMEVTVKDASLLEGLTAEDFTLTGQATGWMTPLHDFTATIADVSVNENVLTLTIADFADKFFYVDNFTVTCTKDENLTFTDRKVTDVITPIADEFEQIQTENGLTYNLYTPEETEAQPLVITFHGFLDDDNLLQNRLAVAWAKPENQAERPCYVMAPVMGGYSYYAGAFRDATYVKVYEEVQKMIEEGKVDPERIYVVGKSFGGRAVYEFLAKYPELPAGAIAMCGAMETYFSDPVALENLVDIPLWIAHATTDPTVNVADSRKVYDTLVDLGSTVVHFTEYSDEEMAAAGVTAAMGNHSMEAVVLEDVSYMEWLFAQPEPVELPFTDVADTNWFAPYVEYVYTNGLMVGTSDTTFGPNDILTRAQFATILYRIEGEPEVEYNDTFTDVPAEEWYTDAVAWASANKIVVGYGNGKFGPSDTLTREQLVLMLYRYAEMKEYDVSKQAAFGVYKDNKEVHSWAETAMKWAVGNEIVLGINETTLAPRGNASRAECATMIMRFVELYK